METVPHTDTNIELNFTERGCPLSFRCRAAGIGSFEVRVYDDPKTKQHQVAHLVGGDECTPMPEVISNDLELSGELLADLYHMARCRREMKRVGESGENYEGYTAGYKFHRERFAKEWKAGLRPAPVIQGR